MRQHPRFRALWYAVNGLLCASLLLFVYAVVKDYSTRSYLSGFADAVVPLSAPPEKKVEAILHWMENGPERLSLPANDLLAGRDPQRSLNVAELLKVCGTATNAFVNLARSSGLDVRRLLLLDSDRRATHVVAEVKIDGRWVVVDPTYRRVLRDAAGRMLTRQQLRDPAILQRATRDIPGYPAEYDYDLTAHIRLSRVPHVGETLRRTLDRLFPDWEEKLDWTLLLERKSFALAVLGALLVVLNLVGRTALSWYAEKRLKIMRVRLRDRLERAGAALIHGLMFE